MHKSGGMCNYEMRSGTEGGTMNELTILRVTLRNKQASSYPDLESHFKVFSHVSIKDFHIQIEVEPVVDIGGILVTKEERRGENLSPRGPG